MLYRLVDEWFINMGPKPQLNTERGQPFRSGHLTVAPTHTTEEWNPTAFRTQIKNVVEDVKFLPESLNGQAREIDWLRNMGDWMISKKRFWGLALPIWVDEQTGDFEVIGSYAELKERAVEGWQEFDGNSPHRPWVDKVKIRNPKTGNLMSRIPDVGNPWLDAGIVAFSTMKYNQDRDYWRKWYPADFITESFPGQFRNWFYALLALSTMMSDGEPPFKTLLGHGLVRDQFGHEMHKSAGNSIEFVAAADTGGTITDPKGQSLPFHAIGADVMRWLYCRQNPATNLNFGPGPADEVRSKFIFKLWNSYAFFCNCAAGDGFDPTKPAHQVPVSERPDLDRWVLAALDDLTLTANENLKNYNTTSFALYAEKFVDEDLSNWYVRRVKPRLNSKVADLDEAGLKDKWAAYQTLYTVLTTLCRLLAPCIPFITEVMWRNLTDTPESVHLTEYPKTKVPEDLYILREMDTLRDVITLGGAARNVAKISTRQPLAELAVRVLSDEEVATVKRFDQLIRDELNVKAVTVHPPTAAPLLSATARFNAKTANAKLGAKRKDAEAELAKRDARELAKQLRTGPVEFAGVPLEAADVLIEFAAAQPGYAGTADGRGREGVVSTTITEELKLEGLARNVVRQVNIARKDADLDLADTITLHLHTTAELLAKAIAAHRDTIATEAQATAWSETVPDGGHRSETKIDGHPLLIAFRKG